jgi:hypothetical protein
MVLVSSLPPLCLVDTRGLRKLVAETAGEMLNPKPQLWSKALKGVWTGLSPQMRAQKTQFPTL